MASRSKSTEGTAKHSTPFNRRWPYDALRAATDPKPGYEEARAGEVERRRAASVKAAKPEPTPFQGYKAGAADHRNQTTAAQVYGVTLADQSAAVKNRKIPTQPSIVSVANIEKEQEAPSEVVVQTGPARPQRRTADRAGRSRKPRAQQEQKVETEQPPKADPYQAAEWPLRTDLSDFKGTVKTVAEPKAETLVQAVESSNARKSREERRGSGQTDPKRQTEQIAEPVTKEKEQRFQTDIDKADATALDDFTEARPFSEDFSQVEKLRLQILDQEALMKKMLSKIHKLERKSDYYEALSEERQSRNSRRSRDSRPGLQKGNQSDTYYSADLRQINAAADTSYNNSSKYVGPFQEAPAATMPQKWVPTREQEQEYQEAYLRYRDDLDNQVMRRSMPLAQQRAPSSSFKNPSFKRTSVNRQDEYRNTVGYGNEAARFKSSQKSRKQPMWLPDRELRPSIDKIVKSVALGVEPRRNPRKSQPNKRYQSQVKYNGELYDIKYEEGNGAELVGLEMRKSVGPKPRSRSYRGARARPKPMSRSKQNIISANLNEFRRLRESFKSLQERHADSSNADLNSRASSSQNVQQYYDQYGSTALDSDVMQYADVDVPMGTPDYKRPKRVQQPQTVKIKKFKSQMSANGDSYRSPDRVAPWSYTDAYNGPQAQTVVRQKDLQRIGHQIDNWSPSEGRGALKQAILEQLSANQVPSLLHPPSNQYL